jgi:cell division septal protein FtsQ
MSRTPPAGPALLEQPGSAFRRPQRNQLLRRSRRRQRIRRGAWGGGAAVVLLALLAWAGVAGMDWLRATPLLAVDHIRLEGVAQADGQGLTAALAGLQGRNLLATDLDQVRRRLLADPWVADAVVWRILPDTLAARIEERQPVAVAVLDDVLTLVDRTGEAIVAWHPRLGPLDLPLLAGLEEYQGAARAAQVRSGLDALAELRRHDPALLARLAELDLAAADRITARFTDETAPVILSRDQVTSNLDHYLAVRDDMRGRLTAVQAIDLRWRGRVVVVPQSGEPARKTKTDG